MAQRTTLPTRPSKHASVDQQVWTVWEMLLYYINLNDQNVGTPGPPGPVGPPGPSGSGGDLSFGYTQVSASSTWSVAHNLGKFPAVSVTDSGGNELIPDVDYIDANHVTLGFGAPTSGKAYFN